MRQLFYNRPWLFPVLGFLAFVAVWVTFIVFASRHKPQEVTRMLRPVPTQVEKEQVPNK